MQRYFNSRNCLTHPLSSATYSGGLSSLMLILFLLFSTGTQLHAQTGAAAASSEQSAAQKTFTLKNSQTLDKVVQEVYKDSPLSFPILRNALLKANPLILSGNPAQRIKAGLTLTIPDHSQLVMQTLSALTNDAEGTDKQGRHYSADASARRNWVRFP
jgi:hypothetical protein